MNSVKMREITAHERTLCEMMATNMKQLPATSTGFEITGLEIVTVPFEPEVQP
jgi:hypothetical protein